MVKANVELVVKADDKASGKLQGISNKMRGMSATFRKAGLGMMGMGVALGGALFAMAKKTADLGDEIAKMAKRTGFAVETLSELRHVAQISGTELGSIEKATKRMSGAILDAVDGMETYIRAFEHLGINVQELAALTPEEQFWKISYALADLEDHTMKVALAQDIFGRAGTELLPMLEEGAEGIANLRQEAHELGVVFDEESAKEAEEMKDAMTRLQTAIGGVAKEIADVIMPDISKFADKLVEIIKNVRIWIDENPKLVTALKILVGVLLAGGGILFALSQIAKVIIAINAALAIFHGLSGPAGWIKMAAGLAIAGGAIATIMQLTKMPETPGAGGRTIIEEGGMTRVGPPTMKFGGIVPGPPGQAVPIIAHGGEPFGGVGGSLGTTIYVTIEGSVVTEEQISELVYEKLLRRKGRNYTAELG